MVMLIAGTHVFGTSREELITVQAGQVWNDRAGLSRSGYYNDVQTCLYAVYPISGTDTYTHLQFKASNSSGIIILNSPYYVLHEGDGVVQFLIKNGYLNTQIVYFSFRGNDPNLGAKADVWYDAK